MLIKKIFKRFFYELGWFANRFYSINVPNDIKLVVSSIGGTATTSLIEFLSKYLKTNDIYDVDKLKHSRRYKLTEEQKMIFIIADPEIAYKSLKRRKYLYPNCLKLGLVSYFIRIKSLFIKEVNTLQTNMEMLSKQYPHKYLTIKFDDLFNSAKIIKDFTDIKDDEFIKRFPSKKNRHSK